MKLKISSLPSGYPKVWFVSIIILIVIAAHPVGPMQIIGHRIWLTMATMGMDVAMTPFTADMALMVDQKDGDSFYERKMSVLYRKQGHEFEAPWQDLHFYRFRLPLLLFFDWSAHGTVSVGHIRAICRFLEQTYGGVETFKIAISPSRDSDIGLGLSREWRCDAN